MGERSCGSAFARVRSNLLAGTAVAVGVLAGTSLASAQKGCGSQGLPTCTYSANLGFFALGPNAAPLTSWDISWVDSDSQKFRGYPATPLGNDFYYLADRTNKAIDVVPIENNPPIFFITSPTAPFAGITTAGNNVAGPNGVMTFTNPAAAFTSNANQVWVADGPTPDPSCMAATDMPVCSTVKVFAGNNAALVRTIPTGNGKAGTMGVNRADELCYDGDDGIVLVANDADSPPFDTFISTKTGQVLGRTVMDGGTGNGPNATNGIEQCQYINGSHFFYQNLPEVDGKMDDSSPGMVIRFNAANIPQTVGASGPVNVPVESKATIPITACAGPQGMTIGPFNQILLGCNAQTSIDGGTLNGPQNSVVIADGIGGPLGALITTLTNQGGSDEVWFEPGSNNYFLANGSAIPAQTLGIADSVAVQQSPGGTAGPIQNAFVGFSGSTTRRSHSVAGWSGHIQGVGPEGTMTSLALLPVAQLGGTPAPFSSTLCAPAAVDTGCIALFSNFMPPATQ